MLNIFLINWHWIRKRHCLILDVSPFVLPGSLWTLHPQYGSGSDRRQAAGHRHGAAGLLQPRLAHLQKVVLARGRLHHSGSLRHGRSCRVFRWDEGEGGIWVFLDENMFKTKIMASPNWIAVFDSVLILILQEAWCGMISKNHYWPLFLLNNFKTVYFRLS